MAKSGSSSAGGIGFFGLLTIVFIVLKLIGVISWPWIWVLSPILIPVSITAAILAIVFIVLAVDERSTSKRRAKR